MIINEVSTTRFQNNENDWIDSSFKPSKTNLNIFDVFTFAIIISHLFHFVNNSCSYNFIVSWFQVLRLFHSATLIYKA